MSQNYDYNEILGDIDLSKLSKEELVDVESYVSGFFEGDDKSFKNQEKYDYDIDSEYEYDDEDNIGGIIFIENLENNLNEKIDQKENILTSK